MLLFRRVVPPAAAAALLLSLAVPAHAADDATFRITSATFTGFAVIEKARVGRGARIVARSTTCLVAGQHALGAVPFVANCSFQFETGYAAISTNCTGVWTHVSTLSFVIPATGESVEITYDPTVTTIEEGDGTGAGANSLHLGHVHFTIASLCATTSSETSSAEGNLAGYATAT